MTPCERCGRDTPDQPHCVWCGVERGYEAGPSDRRHRYAAQPGEHVTHASPVTTLMPHLPTHRIHEFRWALIGGLAVVVILVSTGLVVASILAAAVLVPVLYLVYLYDAQVYRDEPAQVLGLTVGAGVVLGVIVTVVANHLSASGGLLASHETVGLLLGTTLLLPVVQEVLKPLPTLLLRNRPAFGETIDGLVFGVAAALGFTAAETIVDFAKVIAQQPVHTHAASWLLPVVGIAVLNPLLQASCTGIVVAALWPRRRDDVGVGPSAAGSRRPGIVVAGAVAIGAHVAYSLVSQLLQNHGVAPAAVLAWQVVVIIPVLIAVRWTVHHSLLDEAAHFGFHTVVCPHCRRHVATTAFCPICGAAVSAAPREEAGLTAAAQSPVEPASSPPDA